MAKYILIQTSLHPCRVFFLVHFSFSLTNKEIFNAICLVDDLLELKFRREIRKACQNWNVFQDFCKKCLWKYFCRLCFLSEDIAGNSNWKYSLCNLPKTCWSFILQWRNKFKVLVIYTFNFSSYSSTAWRNNQLQRRNQPLDKCSNIQV